MKALQKDKRTIQQHGKSKENRNGKLAAAKKSPEADLTSSMIFSEYDMWPVLAELNERKN